MKADVKLAHADDLAGLDRHARLPSSRSYPWGKRSDEAFEELLILCAQGSERHGHGGLPRSKSAAYLAGAE